MRLRDASLRRHLESEHGLFIAEDEKVIRRALAAGYRPRSFSLPWARLADWASAPRQLVAHRRRVAVLLGTEGAGLSRQWTTGADARAVIPMHRGIDSLNVAAASAIACLRVGPRPTGRLTGCVSSLVAG